MPGKGGKYVGGIGARDIINPFISLPPHHTIVPTPSPPIIPSQPTIVPSIPTISTPLTSPSFVPVSPSSIGLVTLTRIVTISAQSTVRPSKTMIITSTISVSDAQKGGNDQIGTNIAAIIFGILVGLVIIGGAMAIAIRLKFSKIKENKRNKFQRPSVNENVHNDVPNTELPGIISNDQISRRNSLYYHPQFPLPPPRHPLPRSRLLQHPPQIPHSSSATNTRNPPFSRNSAYIGEIPNYYQKYSQSPIQTATDATSSRNEQSQFSSTRIPK